jgi:hypothetical protein
LLLLAAEEAVTDTVAVVARADIELQLDLQLVQAQI